MKKKKLTIQIVTAFPGLIKEYTTDSMFKRAVSAGLLEFKFIDLRKFGEGVHKKIDERPFGGGPGMVLQFDPIWQALKSVKTKAKTKNEKVILFSLRGRKLTGKIAEDFSKLKKITLVCGRYEGVDERVAENLVDEEISIGDYVLSGGELPALVLSEAVARFLPGFLGKQESLESIRGSYPAYSRPEKIINYKKGKVLKVPEILLSGDHKKIAEWRLKNSSL